MTKIDFKKIVAIKNKSDLKKFSINKPINNYNNYLFHYLIQLRNLNALKISKYPIQIENSDKLNGFHLAAKEYDFDVFCHLIETYSKYIYNRNLKGETWAYYLPYENFNELIKKFPNLDWDDLLINGYKKPYVILNGIVSNLNYKDLIDFLKLYKIKPDYENFILFYILTNHIITDEQKIKLFDNYSLDELNIRDEMGYSLLMQSILKNNEKIFNYLLNRNVEYDNYVSITTENPLRIAMAIDITNNKFIFSKKLLEKYITDKKDFITQKNKWLDNYVHTLLYIRYNREKQINTVDNINMELDKLLMNYINDDVMNEINVEKRTPLDLIGYLTFENNINFYVDILIKKNIAIDPKIIERLKKNNQTTLIKIYEKLPVYKRKEIDVNIENNEYTHSTLFQAKFKDIGIYMLSLYEKYSELYLPNMESYQLKNITFDNAMKFSDDILMKEPIFPWIISYHNENEYHIHSYLNNLINSERRNNKRRFAVVFLSIVTETGLHANILIYDFKKMLIERFEPYGDVDPNSLIDEILEEELTWNTGFKYISPKDYMPIAGFQTISDENNDINLKPGDYGGFCLAWCLWYLETKIKNADMDSKTLVNKLIKKLSNSKLKFVEYIRNYSNKINEARVKYYKDIGIKEREISNKHLSIANDIKIANYFINKFTNLK